MSLLSTLLEKALEIRRKLAAENPFFEDSDQELLKSVPEEERKKIISQIDNVVTESRTNYKNFNFTSIHSDSLIPMIINTSAIIIIAAFTVIFLVSFDIDQEKIIAETESNFTAEGKIIEVLQKESEEKLRKKEGEIASIKEMLNSLRMEHDDIRKNTEDRLKSIENDLKLSMESELESERTKLMSQGVSETEIDEKLKVVYADLESDYNDKLNNRTLEFEQDEKERQAVLDKVISEYELMIGTAETEASDLEKTLVLYKEESNKQKQETSLQKEKYKFLKVNFENERIITSQIHSGYKESGKLIGAGDYDNALLKISNLEGYINQPEIASLSFVSERRGMDILLIQSLRNLIDEERKVELKTDPELLDSARVITLIGSRFSEGNLHYQSNNKTTAEKYYKDAFSIIPEMDTGVGNLIEIEKEKQRKELIPAITLTAAERILLEELSEKEKSRNKLRNSLTELRAGINVTENNKKERRKSLIPLLQTKLKVREILSSESVRNENPDLYSKLEDYIRAYGRDKETSGIEKGLNEVNSIIRSLINSDVSVYYQVDENEELEFFFLIDGLEKLIGY